MENGYIDFDALVRRAHQERAEAVANILLHTWKHLTEWVSHLLHHEPHGHGHFAKS